MLRNRKCKIQVNKTEDDGSQKLTLLRREEAWASGRGKINNKFPRLRNTIKIEADANKWLGWLEDIHSS